MKSLKNTRISYKSPKNKEEKRILPKPCNAVYHTNFQLMDNTSTVIGCGTATGKQHLAILDYTSTVVNLSV